QETSIADERVPFIKSRSAPERAGHELRVRADRHAAQTLGPLIGRFLRYNQSLAGRQRSPQKWFTTFQATEQAGEQRRLAGLPLAREERHVARRKKPVPQPAAADRGLRGALDLGHR